MLTIENLPAALTALGFMAVGRTFTKAISGSTRDVSREAGVIRYPEADGLIVNERQTCNLSANENFVVLECVHRLLVKGYRPQNIELEPKWQLGRGASGARTEAPDGQGAQAGATARRGPGRDHRRPSANAGHPAEVPVDRRT